MTEKSIDRIIEILRKLIEVSDLEIKNCGLLSLIEMMEEEKGVKNRKVIKNKKGSS